MNKRLYRIYYHMKNRCYNSKSPKYSIYGGRGIKVCEQWLNNKQSFFDWAISNGYQDNLTIDRINVNGNYEPSNCRWVTLKEQANNKRNNIKFCHNGTDYNLVELSDKLGIDYKTLYARLKVFNYDVDRLINSPLHIRTNYDTKSGYRYIYKCGNSYSIQIKKKYYGCKNRLEDAIELRDKILQKLNLDGNDG